MPSMNNCGLSKKYAGWKALTRRKAICLSFIYDLSNISEYAKGRLQSSFWAFKLMKDISLDLSLFILPTSSELPKIYKNRKEVGIRVPTTTSYVNFWQKRLGNPILTTFGARRRRWMIEYTTDRNLYTKNKESEVDVVIDGGMAKPLLQPL